MEMGVRIPIMDRIRVLEMGEVGRVVVVKLAKTRNEEGTKSINVMIRMMKGKRRRKRQQTSRNKVERYPTDEN